MDRTSTALGSSVKYPSNRTILIFLGNFTATKVENIFESGILKFNRCIFGDFVFLCA